MRGWRALCSRSSPGASTSPADAIIPSNGQGCVDLGGEGGFGQREVDLADRAFRCDRGPGMLADLLAQPSQDPLDLPFLLQLRLAPSVAHLHHRQRFHEHCGAAGRDIVDHAGRWLRDSALIGIT